MARTYPAPAPGEEASIALSLVNTRIEGPRGTVELLGDAPDLSYWLRRVVSSATADAQLEDLQVALELRSAIRALFMSATGGESREPATIATVNRVAAADAGAPQLTLTGMPTTVVWAGSGSNSAFTALSRVARDAIAVLVAETPLAVCAAQDCNRLFVPDHGRRIWCSSTCGGRARGLRHYARTKKAGI